MKNKFRLSLFVAIAGAMLPAHANPSQPWLVALDAEKNIAYFDGRGNQLSRSRLVSPTKIEDCVDIEIGDFIPGDGWFELILLRKGYWFETFPLPRPGESSVKRLSYHRFQPVKGYDPLSVALVNFPKDPEKMAMLVAGRQAETTQLNRLFLYELLNKEERSQVKVMSIVADWPGVSGEMRMATLGQNCGRANLAVLTSDNSLWIGRKNEGGPVQWLIRRLAIPGDIEPVHIRFVADRLYLLDARNRVHTWTFQGETLKPAGKPVRLDSSGRTVAIAPLQR